MLRRSLIKGLGVWTLSATLVGTAGVATRASEDAGTRDATAPVTAPHRPAPLVTTTSTTAAPAPRPKAAPAPVAPPPPPAPEPAPSVVDVATDAVGYAMSLVRAVVPARWLAAVPVQISVIPGNTSWSSYGGLIELGDWHLFDKESRARFTIAHEWGHQAAWVFGPDTYDGEPPRGFPYGGPDPAEQWADCVGQALTGYSYPSHGLGGCSGDALSFTSGWLAAGPR